ncbi:hypothetical protein X777_02115 [Ooceraea biroi]|uniref:Uncharacterized protein n=1 Tax=Ooceraea biroi TaxID=2015173 RepID=A0A026WNG7_OOCBI|nr:hypothetical protein X777_02115 [Ooceraea biroi]
MIELAIRYFEVHPIVASADCETRMQIPAWISLGSSSCAKNIFNLVRRRDRCSHLLSPRNFVLLFMKRGIADELGPQDTGGNRRRGWKMITLRLETVLVGDVAYTNGLAVRVGIAERSLNANSVFSRGDFSELALFLRLNAISGLVAVAV